MSELDLSRCSLGPSSGLAERFGVTQMVNLRKLDISDNELSMKCLDVLSEALPRRCPKLEELLCLDNPFCQEDNHYLARLLLIPGIKKLDHASLGEGIRELITGKRNEAAPTTN